MRNISVETKGYKPEFNMTLTDGNNHSYTITDHDVQADSLAIRTGTSNSGELTVGAAVIGSLSVGLLNDGSNYNKFDNVTWRGAYIEATFTVHGTNVQLGRYYVNEHSEQGGAIRVVAYDAMQILDGYQIYEHNFTYPLNAVTAVNTIKTALAQRTQQQWQVVGLTDATAQSLSLPDPGTDKMSERAFLSYVAQILCKYVVVKRMNGIETIFFGWYDTAHPVRNVGTTFSHDLKTSEYNPENFQIKVYDSSYTVTVRGPGSTGPLTNAVYIENNPFIRSSNVGLPNPGGGMAYDIYSQVHALTYRPGTVDILADIALEAGDVITVSTGPLGGTYKMIITNLTFGTGLTMNVSSDADPSDDMIFNPSTYFKKATEQAISDELADSDSELSKALGGGGDPDLELITIPRVEVICAVDGNDDPTMGFYKGVTMEFQPYQNNGILTYRNKSSAQSIGGIEIMRVIYPEQKIYIPKNEGAYCYTELLITGIVVPDYDEYRNANIDEATHSCNFYPNLYEPAKIRVRVRRGSSNTSQTVRFIDLSGTVVGDDNTSPTGMRPLAFFNGLEGKFFTSWIGGKFRAPICEIPLPGNVFDFSDDATTGGKWCRTAGTVMPTKYINYPS